jgi:hypothetical protein
MCFGAIRATLTAVLLALAAAAPAAAAAVPDPIAFTKLADATGPVRTDIRYAAWPTATGVDVLDTTTGALSHHDPPAPRCDFQALGGARLLWQCIEAGWPQRVRVEHIPSRTISVVEYGGDTRFHAVGRHWLHGLSSGNHYSGVSGWFRIGGSGRHSSNQRMEADEVEDLDRPGLFRALCSPLRRDPTPGYEFDTNYHGDPYLPYTYEPPYGLRHNGGSLHLDRCGSTDIVYLDGRARSSQLLGGWVTWVRGSWVNALFPARRARYSWRFDQRDSAAEGKIFAAHTRKHVFVATSPRSQPGTWRIFRARVRG